MLKQVITIRLKILGWAAAFGRLCVETFNPLPVKPSLIAAAFGRLCVETSDGSEIALWPLAAAFGRLCVETIALASVSP